MKNSVESITISAGGKSVETTPEGLAYVANEVATLTQIIVEAKGQIDSLLTSWGQDIYRTYKANGNEIKVALGINLEGNSQMVTVRTSINFSTGKISDAMVAEIKLNQPRLKGLDECELK